MTTRISIFDIPLLLDLICEDLVQLDIQRCIRVCKDWQAVFYPYLWQHIQVSRRCTLKRLRTKNTILSLKDHAPLIRSITTHYSDVFRWLGENPPLNRRERKHGLALSSKQRQGKERIVTSSIEATPEDGTLGTHPRSMDEKRGVYPSQTTNVSRLKSVVIQRVHGEFTPRGLFQPFPFNKLAVLRCVNHPGKRSNIEANLNHLDRLLDVVELSINLQVLEMNQFEFLDVNLVRLNTVIWNHPTLQDVTICSPKALYFPDLREILRHCTRLKRLGLGCIPVAKLYHTGSGWGPTPEEKVYYDTAPQSRLVELDFGGFPVYSCQGELLDLFFRLCGHVRRMVVPRRVDSTEFARAIMSHLPSLTYLDLSCSQLHDPDIHRLISAVSGLEGFKAPKGNLANSGMILGLLSHSTTLTEIHIGGCSFLKGEHVQQLLTSCPYLVCLRAADERTRPKEVLDDAILTVLDIKRFPQRWCCKGLRSLSLTFAPTEKEIIPKAICDRVGQLSLLEDIFLTRHSTTVDLVSFSTAACVSVVTAVASKSTTVSAAGPTLSGRPLVAMQSIGLVDTLATLTVKKVSENGHNDESNCDPSNEIEEERPIDNLEMVIKMCLGFQKLRSLRFANFDLLLDNDQLLRLKEGIPKMAFVQV